ncbi:hypothetical protein SEMRO_2710_G335240.1 [Seminavis robusta]|uniref:Uncharacterized protein n=1 Tax=Seminavis robusta TaxID=568900 RepID=A0A9N8F3S6_9STRA|nr:hypothetical protein SEMRO_2710_G335240.1 [Seminavis robusta]|eukprot:Sro2710_g335240.1 n/a (231) ;mRNA; r:761-1453
MSNHLHMGQQKYPTVYSSLTKGSGSSLCKDRFFNQEQNEQPPTHTPVTTGLTPTTAYTSPGYQTVPMEELSKQVDSDIVRPKSKPSLFSNLEGTSPMDKVTQGRIPDRFGDPGDPGGSGYHGGGGNHRGFSRKAGMVVPQEEDPLETLGIPMAVVTLQLALEEVEEETVPDASCSMLNPMPMRTPPSSPNKDFDQWYSVFITTARAQGFYALFDSNYVPLDQESASELRR